MSGEFVDARIRSFVESLIQMKGETEPENTQSELWEKVQTVGNLYYPDPQKFYESAEETVDDVLIFVKRVFNVSFDYYELAISQDPKYAVFHDLEKAVRSLERKGVALNYAYWIRPYPRVDTVALFFTGDPEKYKELKSKLRDLIDEIRFFLADTIQFAEYKLNEEEKQRKAMVILNHYPEKLRRYMDISFYFDTITIAAAAQITGRIIGKQGCHVKELSQKLNAKIKVVEDKYLTELYAKEQGIRNDLDPETMNMLTQVLDLLEKLKRKGITIYDIMKLIEPKEEPAYEPDDFWEVKSE